MVLLLLLLVLGRQGKARRLLEVRGWAGIEGSEMRELGGGFFGLIKNRLVVESVAKWQMLLDLKRLIMEFRRQKSV